MRNKLFSVNTIFFSFFFTFHDMELVFFLVHLIICLAFSFLHCFIINFFVVSFTLLSLTTIIPFVTNFCHNFFAAHPHLVPFLSLVGRGLVLEVGYDVQCHSLRLIASSQGMTLHRCQMAMLQGRSLQILLCSHKNISQWSKL